MCIKNVSTSASEKYTFGQTTHVPKMLDFCYKRLMYLKSVSLFLWSTHVRKMSEYGTSIQHLNVYEKGLTVVSDNC